MKKKEIIVIGGGFSGLAVSALLARSGHKVILFEKNKELGGRARVMRKRGFSFDMGPSWYMMPEVFERFFARFGYRVDQLYKLVRLDPRYKVIFSDSKEWMLGDDIESNKGLFEKEEQSAGRKLEEYLGKTREGYDLATFLIYKDIFSPKTWFSVEVIWRVLKLTTLLPWWLGWYQWMNLWFGSEIIKKVLTFSSVFLGGNPYKTPSLYSILSWADFGRGIWYPMGGVGMVVKSLERVALENGVEMFKKGVVSRIITKEGRVRGVRVEGKEIECDLVVGSGDLASMELKLLTKKDQSYKGSYWRKKDMAISAMMIYLGIGKRLKTRVHHQLYFCEDWKGSFEAIGQGRIPMDPSLYISVRSVSDRTIVPKGKEEVVVLVPVGARVDYKAHELEDLKESVLVKLEEVLGEKIRDDIEVMEVFGPRDFASAYSAYKGTALGLSHTLGQSLWFRPGNRSRKVRGLYYVGQYTNPGVGLPMALISAELVEGMINEEI